MLETVIKGLECCAENVHCGQCPYSKYEDIADCTGKLTQDALALLKPMIPVYPGTTQTIEGIGFTCGVCGTVLFSQKDTATLEYNKKLHRFCQYCGQAVKWDG